MPGLLSQSPPWVRGIFDHTWAPMEAMARQVHCLPPALWDFMLKLDCGFVAIRSGDSEYVPGPARLRQHTVQNVAYVSVTDLAQDNERPLHVLGHLLDHHLGCGGAVEGRWFSQGGGLVPEWQLAGERLPRLFSLGYAVDSVAESSVQDYFAQSLALYCRERQHLNTADPQIYKWLRNTLWDKGFWRAEKRHRGFTEEND
ncbi:MAG: hypothetical protein PVI80_02445 [Anaerolineae bacterium]